MTDITIKLIADEQLSSEVIQYLRDSIEATLVDISLDMKIDIGEEVPFRLVSVESSLDASLKLCVGCFQNVATEGHAYGCPTGQNGPPNYE